MAGINLKTITKHKVSTNLDGYMTYLYGPGGSGKTSFGAEMEKPLLLAFERGYNAIADISAVDVTTWSEMKQILRQLDDPEVKDLYRSIIVDTVDLASRACEKYICNQLGIENIGDGGWSTNGWATVKKEWEQTFNAMAMKGYAILFISHSKEKTFKRKDGTEYTQIVPSCSNAYNEIIKNMVDLQGYIHVENNERTLILRSSDDTIECKSRFKYIDSEISFSYDNLAKALQRAIEKEGEIKGKEFITNEREVIKEAPSYDYDDLMTKVQSTIDELMTTDQSNAIKITSIVKKYLKDKKVLDCTPSQCEQLELILTELNDLLKA